ncbi:MAG: hypothetical protein JXB88_22860 [Spirochaetales bacterium]|nr:hypothetical protein [Spirochaetales bacterium]
MFTGYSSICLARGLNEGGTLYACDRNKEWTDIAQKYWHRAGLSGKIELRLGPAEETLKGLLKEGLLKEGLLKEGLLKEGLLKEGLLKERLLKERLLKEGLLKEGLLKEGLLKERLLKEGLASKIDLGFIDADKTGYDIYYELMLELLHPGGVILFDNMLHQGMVTEPDPDDLDTLAIDSLNKKLHKDRRVEICLVPIGDGVTMALKV